MSDYQGDLDERMMRLALLEAEGCLDSGDVPVGAVIARDGEMLTAAGNARERLQDPTAHAEVLALREASSLSDSWRLDGCTLYVTLEPCAMCAGAMVLSRISRVIFGAWDSKAGMAGSVGDLLRHPVLNHTPEVCGGLLEEDCRVMLTSFFESMRAYSRG